MPIAVLTAYTEKEYEPFDPYSRFYPAMPVSVCFSDTALCTLGKCRICFFVCIENVEDTACVFARRDILRRDENHFCLKKRV